MMILLLLEILLNSAIQNALAIEEPLEVKKVSATKEMSLSEVKTAADMDLKGADLISSLRDPFKAPTLAVARKKPQSALELFSPTELKLTGVITGPDRKKAMLVGPDGVSYFVSERTKIGAHKGFVSKITPEKVIVMERIPNVLGKEEPTYTEIVMAKVTESKFSVSADDVEEGSVSETKDQKSKTVLEKGQIQNDTPSSDITK